MDTSAINLLATTLNAAKPYGHPDVVVDPDIEFGDVLVFVVGSLTRALRKNGLRGDHYLNTINFASYNPLAYESLVGTKARIQARYNEGLAEIQAAWKPVERLQTQMGDIRRSKKKSDDQKAAEVLVLQEQVDSLIADIRDQKADFLYTRRLEENFRIVPEAYRVNGVEGLALVLRDLLLTAKWDSASNLFADAADYFTV